TSCGVPMRPIGLRDNIVWNSEGLFSSTTFHTPPLKGTLPGETMLARMFFAARLRASALTRPAPSKSPGRRAPMPRSRRRSLPMNDRAGLRLLEEGQRRLDAGYRSDHVDLQAAPPGLVVHALGERADIGDKDVEAAERLGGPRHPGAQRLG